MRKAIVLAALFLGLGIPALAQDEAPGQQVQITASVPVGGFSCGRASYPVYCFGVSANVGGTLWLDAYTNSYPSPSGFIEFSGVLDLGQARITNTIVTRNALGQVSQLTVAFSGSTVDDGGTYSGTAYFTFSYVKMKGGSGRGGGYPGYLLLMTGGALTITYN